MVLTSPPYANRYDYTRTYALELAWLDYDQSKFNSLRQRMLSATVENQSKRAALWERYEGGPMISAAQSMYDEQGALQEVLEILRSVRARVGQPTCHSLAGGLLLRNGADHRRTRAHRPSGPAQSSLVNDNVRYHGEEVPVDLILSDFAESAGFSLRPHRCAPPRQR